MDFLSCTEILEFGFREGQAKARELGLYMQKYCGCVFSEEDRYIKQIEKNNKEVKIWKRN